MKQIILASQSPRRKELMQKMGLDFDVIPSDFEEWLDDATPVAELAVELGFGKANAVAAQYPDSIVVGSDTIVALNGKQFGKPATRDEAHDMLKQLAGNTHEVISSLAVVRKSDGFDYKNYDVAYVTFKPYDAAAVQAYLDLNDSLDKAAGYGIQSGAAPLVEKLEGQYDTAYGMPSWLLAEVLKELGIDSKPTELVLPDF